METTLTFEKKPQWDEQVSAFATAVGKTPEEIEKALETVVGEPSDDALSLLADASASPGEDLKKAFEGLKIPSAKFNAHLQKLRGPEKTQESKSETKLPTVPDEESFINALKTGGELKVGTNDIIGATKACIASRAGLYGVPEKVLKKMHEWAVKNSEPYGEKYFEIQNMISEKNYAEVLSIIKVKSTFVTETKRKEFLLNIETILWPELKSFHSQLKEWVTLYNQVASTPAAIASAITGKGSTIQHVDTGNLRAASEEVINRINKVFAGPGIPVARALVQDAVRIKKVLNDEAVLVATGAGTKDQLLRDLGIVVGADIVRAEQSIVRYVVSIMNLKFVTAEDEVEYLLGLNTLGSSIPWDKLGGLNGSGLGGGQL